LLFFLILHSSFLLLLHGFCFTLRLMSQSDPCEGQKIHFKNTSDSTFSASSSSTLQIGSESSFDGLWTPQTIILLSAICLVVLLIVLRTVIFVVTRKRMNRAFELKALDDG